MNELNAVAEELSAVWSFLFQPLPGQLFLIALGLLLCFFGYKLTKVLSGLFGVVFGGLLAYLIAFHLVGHSVNMLNVVLLVILLPILAVIFGYLAFAVFRVGVFLFGLTAGAVIASIPAALLFEQLSLSFLLLMIVCGVLCGVLGLLFLQQVVIVASSLGGFLPAGPIIGLLGNTDSAYRTLLGLVLTVAGFAFQLHSNPGALQEFFSHSGRSFRRRFSRQSQEHSGQASPSEETGFRRAPESERWEPADEPLYAETEKRGRRPFVLLLLTISPVAAVVLAALTLAFGMRCAHWVWMCLPFAYYSRRRYGCAIACALLAAREVVEALTLYHMHSNATAAVAAVGAVVYAALTIVALFGPRQAVNPAPKHTRAAPPVEEPMPEEDFEPEGTRPLYDRPGVEGTRPLDPPYSGFYDTEGYDNRTQRISRSNRFDSRDENDLRY